MSSGRAKYLFNSKIGMMSSFNYATQAEKDANLVHSSRGRYIVTFFLCNVQNLTQPCRAPPFGGEKY